jgi:hypothetical protein
MTTHPQPAGIRTNCVRLFLTFSILVLGLAVARAQDPVTGEILQQDLVGGQGVTVLHVWGSHYDMGYAHGVLLADWIELSYTQMRTAFASYWPQVRARVAGWTFLPAAAIDEFQGILDGVRMVHPETTMDLLDLEVCCTFGDWSYSMACRSTSCWADWVEPPFTTLSARKLQFIALPPQITQQWHHVICAWEPNDGTPAWVNFGFPGYASSVTGVNEYGTVGSLHDWNSASGTNWPNALPRTMACRWILTMDLGNDPLTHLQTAFDALQPYHAATGGFINYYVPDGGAGVIKSSKNLGFYDVRRPRPEYMNGQSISTNNSDISGTTGIEPWDAYYQTLNPPAVRATMEGLWATAFQSTDLHIAEVGFRARQDMTIWFAGRVQSGMGPRVEWEWADLFHDPAAADPPESSPESPRLALGPYPNPAGAGGTTLVFSHARRAGLPRGTDAGGRLSIYDAAGRLVRTLGPVERGAGLRSAESDLVFRWDGRDARGQRTPAGAYTARLEGSGATERVIWIGGDN